MTAVKTNGRHGKGSDRLHPSLLRHLKVLLVPVVAMLLVFITGQSIGAAAATGSDPLAASGPSTTRMPPPVISRNAEGQRRLDAGDSSGRALLCVRHRHRGNRRLWNRPGTGVCPYCVTVANDFPSTAAWGTSTLAQLRSWGFNSLGPFSDDADLGSQMPYEVQLSMASGDDWFAPSFVTTQIRCRDTGSAAGPGPERHRYFTDSELDWGPFLGNNVIRRLFSSTCSCQPVRPDWPSLSSTWAIPAGF